MGASRVLETWRPCSHHPVSYSPDGARVGGCVRSGGSLRGAGPGEAGRAGPAAVDRHGALLELSPGLQLRRAPEAPPDTRQVEGSTTWVQRLTAVVVPSAFTSSAAQNTTRVVRRSTRPTARSVPGRVGRKNSTRRSAVRNTSSLSSVVQQAPPIAESRIAVTSPPWITGPVGV